LTFAISFSTVVFGCFYPFMPIMPFMQPFRIVLALSLVSLAVPTASPATSCPNAIALCVFRNSTAFGSTVVVTEQSTYYSVFSNSIPNHEYLTGINPAVSAQSNTLRIPKTVTRATTTTKTLGTLGVMFNGVSVYSSSDARTFTGCSGNAGALELSSLDSYGGHPDPSGNYHYHVAFFLQSAAKLQLTYSPTAHSSLLGWAADGLPIYGPYGYASNASTTITLLKSCYVLKPTRTCCTNDAQCGTTVKQGQVTLSMGAFNEDYEFNATAYNAGDCHLDEYNTRVAATPEFKTTSTRFYVFTLNPDNTVTYPYIMHGTKGLYGQMMGGTTTVGGTATAGATTVGGTATAGATTVGGTATAGITTVGGTGITTVGGTATVGATTVGGTTRATTVGGTATTGATTVGATTVGGVAVGGGTTTVGGMAAVGGGTTTVGGMAAVGGGTTSGSTMAVGGGANNGNNNNGMSSTTNEASPDSSSNPAVTGIAIGAGVGGVLVLAIIGVGVYFYIKASKARGPAAYTPSYKPSRTGITAPVSTPSAYLV
jgi:hypothetical protein